MARRILALWFQRFAIDLRQRAEPERAKHPLALIAGENGRVLVTAVNAAAAALGAAAGRSLADVRAVVPQLMTLEADPVGDLKALEQLSDWCGRYAPFTAPDPPDGVTLDISGCSHLFGGEECLLDDVLRRLTGQGFAVRAAIADAPAAAWGLARFHPLARVIIEPGALPAALAPLPVAALRLPAATVDGLDAVGVRRVGDLYRLPRAGMATRFGRQAGTRLDQALGRLDEPISPRAPAPTHAARRSFPEPISRPEDLALTVRCLLKELCCGLERAGEGARRLLLSAWRVDEKADAPPQRVAIGTARPARDPDGLARLFAPKLETLAPGPGFEVVALTAPVVGPLHAEQQRFAGHESAVDLGELADILNNRLGERATQRLVPRHSWLPERAVAGASPLQPPSDDPWPPDRARPVRLLTPPEPVEATAPLPDDPPILFRWRGATHRVRLADGPERIAAEWWRRDGPPRDYYRVEDADGRRFWLFRLGLYQSDPPPRWFLHGFFG